MSRIDNEPVRLVNVRPSNVNGLDRVVRRAEGTPGIDVLEVN
jgi:hypothetical protein